jgi:hypothetical protein
MVTFWGSHTTMRSRHLVMAAFLLLLVPSLLLIMTGCDGNKVSVLNDLPYPVSLLACRRDPVGVDAGQVRRIGVFHPCLVRTAEDGDIGCLLFPPEAFKDKDVVIRVSSMDTSIGANDCARKANY